MLRENDMLVKSNNCYLEHEQHVNDKSTMINAEKIRQLRNNCALDVLHSHLEEKIRQL